MKKYILSLGIAVIMIVFCFLVVKLVQKDREPESKVYVTLMAHIEGGDIYTDCLAYPSFREELLDYSSIMHENGYRLNLQISYQFFSGVLNCETPEMQKSTNGMNVIDYLAKEYNFEIDEHHGGAYDWGSEENHADTRYIGGLVTDRMTDIVGIVWNSGSQFKELDSGQQGNVYPDFTFYPEIISGAVHFDHHLGDFSKDDPNSGVWIPAGAGDDFLVHDPEGRMVNVASGPHASCTRPEIVNAFENEIDYIQVLLDYINEGKIEDQLLTVSVAIPQKELFGGASEAVELVRELDSLPEDDRIIWASYTEVVDAWRSDYDSEPQIFLFEDIDSADYTCQ